MEHELVKPNGDASDAQVIEGTSTDYYFDSSELAVEVPHRDQVVAVAYRKPGLEDYLARQKALQWKTRVVDGAMIGSGIKHDADTDFYDLVVMGARARKSDAIAIIREYDADEAKKLPYEIKVKFVKRITAWKFRVEAAGDDLLETQDALTVIQPIGEANSVPVEIAYTMKPLQAKQRQGYENAIQSKTRFKNGDQSVESESHQIEKAMKLFSASFESLTGGRLESGPYTSERRNEFLSQIDPLFQAGVIDAMCEFYGGGQD